MSIPKIKVYRLEKGYNQDSDNDIQSKVNSELLPFIKKPVKSTDAYYMTGLSNQTIQLNGEKINIQPQFYGSEENSIFELGNIVSKKTDITGWITKGFYRPRLGYYKTVSGENKFYELSDSKYNELELLEKIKKVKSGEEISENYFTKQDFVYAHPLIFSNDEKSCYTMEITNNEIQFTLNEEKISEVYGNSPVESVVDYVIQYYISDEESNSLLLENYPVYNHKNYFYTPQLFDSEKIELTIDLDDTSERFRNSQEIDCTDEWIYYGNGSILVTYKEDILDKENYDLLYSYSNERRTVVVKISEEFLTENIEQSYSLYYNTDQSLLKDYILDDDTGLLTFSNGVPDNLFTYYRKKSQRSNLFVSEYPNWSFGHLRENPDIFFGEKDYPGDESENVETGTPIYSGLKPSFISDGYQIDYFRGSVTFTDGYKSVYRSEAEILQDRDIQTAETFVRANFSYYPEVFGVFRQKMELVSDIDGFTYKPVSDNRFSESIDKRWIMKNDDYQPMFFENWTDRVNVCSQYLSTFPGYDQLKTKEVIEILSTNEEFNNNITFILPLIKSKFIVFTGFEKFDTVSIQFNNNTEKIETISLKREVILDEEIFLINDIELKCGEVKVIDTETVKVKFVYLNTYRNSDGLRTDSFQIVSAEIK